MTKAQEEAAECILEIMREHFSAGVVVLCANTEDHEVECDKAEDIRCYWAGGYCAAVGLLEIGRQQALLARKEEG